MRGLRLPRSAARCGSERRAAVMQRRLSGGGEPLRDGPDVGCGDSPREHDRRRWPWRSGGMGAHRGAARPITPFWGCKRSFLHMMSRVERAPLCLDAGRTLGPDPVLAGRADHHPALDRRPRHRRMRCRRRSARRRGAGRARRRSRRLGHLAVESPPLDPPPLVPARPGPLASGGRLRFRPAPNPLADAPRLGDDGRRSIKSGGHPPCLTNRVTSRSS